MATYDTYLPKFSGFYETIWDFDDSQLRDEYDDEILDYIDYKEYQKDVSKRLCKVIKAHTILDLGLQFEDIRIEFDSLYSPNAYNFETDIINCKIALTDNAIQAIQVYIRDNEAKFKEYIKNRYTSYDGFSSYYSNDNRDWIATTKEFTDFSDNKHMLGSVLGFILGDLEQVDLYYNVMDDIDVYSYVDFNKFDNTAEGIKCQLKDLKFGDTYQLLLLKRLNKLESEV